MAIHHFFIGTLELEIGEFVCDMEWPLQLEKHLCNFLKREVHSE